ncbi:MAG: transporter substrate-binding domain-containing protein [Clostridiales bacterium]
MEIKKRKQIYIMAILLVLVLLATAFLFAQESPGGSAARIERGAISSRYDQPLRVGLDQALPPYAYVDSNGVIKGFLADLVYALALEYGLDVELYSRQREEMMASLNKGDLDLVISNAVPPEGYLTSDVLISSEDTIFVRRDNTYISALEELRNLSVAINTISLTSSIGSYINEHSQDKLKIVINQEHGFLLLLNMEVEAYIGNKASGHYLLQKWDQEDFFKSVGESFNIGDFRFFAAAEHEELLALLNSSLSIAKQNGTYDKVGGKWFGQSIKSYEKQVRQIIYIALACLVLFLLLAIIALIFNNRLKKEVDSRTLALNQANQELLRQRNEINAANHFKEEILNSVQNGIITLDAQGALTFINNRAADILELSPGELLGSMIFQSPLFYWLNKEKLAAVLSGQGPYLGIKAKIQGADEVKFIIYQIGALGRDKGDSTGAVISFKDISKEKRLEEELLRQDQSRIMRMQVSEFIHEIRTPMTSIKTLADLLPERIADPQFQTQLAEIINSEMDRISKMVLGVK